MARQLKDAGGLQAEVSRLINALRDVQEDGVSIKVPKPVAVERTDPSQPNWTMKERDFGNARGFERDIARIVQEAQKRFDLKPPSPPPF
jgi:hypothetical protein